MQQLHTPGAVAAVSLTVLLGGCSLVEGPSLAKTSAQWDAQLRDKDVGGTRYDPVLAVDPNVSRVEGLRIWEGSYGNTPIALYTKIMICRHYLCPSNRVASLHSLAIVLVAEPPRAEKRKILAGKVFPYPELDAEQLVVDPTVRPAYMQELRMGGPKVNVVPRQGSKLAFLLNASREPAWHEFDLSLLLPDIARQSKARTLARVYPVLSPVGFAEWVSSSTAGFWQGEGWSSGNPSSEEIRAIDHPLWRDATAVAALLQKAPSRCLVHAVQFMRLMDYVDPYYLASLGEAEKDILRLASHADREVRRAFSEMLFDASIWPRDLSVLEPLLASQDRDVQVAVLATYAKRDRQPADLKRVRQLTQSGDLTVSSWAKDVLNLSE